MSFRCLLLDVCRVAMTSSANHVAMLLFSICERLIHSWSTNILYDSFFFEIKFLIIFFNKLLMKNGWLNRVINENSNNGYVNKSVEFTFDRLSSTGIIMLSKLYEYIMVI